MREIKFRGIIDTDEDFCDDGGVLIAKVGEMIYGQIVYEDRIPFIVGPVVESCEEYICLEMWHPVKPETVGEFTGLRDTNGVEIYEGDILRLSDGDESDDVVHYSEAHAGFNWGEVGLFETTSEPFSSEVVGNKYQHPELLEDK